MVDESNTEAGIDALQMKEDTLKNRILLIHIFQIKIMIPQKNFSMTFLRIIRMQIILLQHIRTM